MRDEFSENTKKVLSWRVGGLCSNPDCKVSTLGPQSNSSKAMNIGVAAHITAASEDGPRYDPALGSAGRKSPENGIWLCQNCAKLIDSDPTNYTVELIKEWKREAETAAFMKLGACLEHDCYTSFSKEQLEILYFAADDGTIMVTSAMKIGTVVQAGKQELGAYDSESSARYQEALENLLGKRIVKRRNREVYELTGTGYSLAKKCKEMMEGT